MALSSASPGVKLTAYGHQGWKSEHGNLDCLPAWNWASRDGRRWTAPRAELP